MTKYTVQAAGLSGYRRRTIEGRDLRQAIAKDHADMVEGSDWGTRVPYPIEVFGKNSKYEISSQQIIDMVAEEYGKATYDTSALTCFG